MNICRLILTEKCNRECPGCVNKQHNFNNYESWDWKRAVSWDQILITGGEPMLFPHEVIAFVKKLRGVYGYSRHTNIYMYTASCVDQKMFLEILEWIHGYCLTLHTQDDVGAFERINSHLNLVGPYDKSMRLNVFRGVTLPNKPYPLWNIKKDIVWLKDCPLPPDETIRVLR